MTARIPTRTNTNDRYDAIAALGLRTLRYPVLWEQVAPDSASANCVVSPTYVPDLVTAALDLLIDGETGIWHLVNQGAVSWGELARLTATQGGFDPDRVRLERADETPINTALASQRGEMLPPLASALERFFRESEVAWETGSGRPSR